MEKPTTSHRRASYKKKNLELAWTNAVKKRRHYSFGVTDDVISWIQSYLCDRTQSVRIGTHSSAVTSCSMGVPQGSVLGPLLFSIYTSPLSTIDKAHNVSQQQYADDTQLYISLSPFNHSDDITRLQSCLTSLHIWFCENGMALNPAKSFRNQS